MKLKLARPIKKACSRLGGRALILAFGLIHAATAAPLISEGIGASKDDARRNALAALSQQILVNVDSRSRSEVQEINDDVRRNNQISVDLQSNIKFQGVTFGEAERKKKIWHVTATLSDAALRQTILFLNERLPEDIDGLTRLQLSETYNEVRQLQALLHFAVQNQLNIPDGVEIKTRADVAVGQIQLRIGNYGWVRFLPPANIAFDDDFTTAIDNETVATANRIFLPVGTFRYHISRDGYADEQGILRISRGREERIALSLVRLPEEPTPVAIRVEAGDADADRAVQTALEEILLRYRIPIDADSPLVLEARADSDLNTAVKNFEHLFVTLNLRFRHYGKTLIAHHENVRLFDKTEDNIGSYQWQKLSEKALTALIAGDGLVSIMPAKN